MPLLEPKKSAPGTEETTRFVVEAVVTESDVVVAFVKTRLVPLIAVVDAYGNCEATVDDEKKLPPKSWIEVPVAAVEVLQLEVKVKVEAEEFWSVAQEKVPLAHVRYCPTPQPPSPVT